MLTAHKVQGDIMALLADSKLCKALSGKVYRKGYRPRDSRMEDTIVIFVSGFYGQIERGAVTLNIYVPDITPYNDGVYVEDGRRLEQVEQLAAEWVKSLNASCTPYLFTLSRTIDTMPEDAIHQHFVVVHLEYTYKG